ncbi:MAG: hydrogen peroxide-inducible genes activator [Gammaproteobacteria bacterium]|nr:LysR family transcriptional regulator [Gammaproteobacteria bacterium]NIN62369.1 LysR family transcriptional regulator [Gammaproteobacteria bacterium]NIO61423.1 LysR family transcriptional regulator [Gammaproteobacteria bacterium]NIP49862.1 hydrogen peroxide-inducible genes activator [Gammaproteobacteria bacterium]NIQ11895.1 hydrogen peroxide-inducible genes activator [Gammaproteobacteria bacterium]
MNLPTNRQLQYFIALEKHRHFGKAAEACFVSQPAFSVAIQELESLLNVQLVDRNKKQVTITAIGKAIATQARLALTDMEVIIDIARENQQPLSGHLSLGVIPTIAPFLLPELLPRLRKSFPKLDLFLHEDQTERVYELMMQGQLDVILIALPYRLRGVESLSLFRDNFHLACRKGSRLIDPENYVIDNLPEESVLLLEDGHCLRDHALSACKIRSLDKVSKITASSLLTLVQMVDADLGVTFIPEMALHSNLLKHTHIITRPLAKNSFREIGLVWRKGSRRTKEFKLLAGQIQPKGE